MSTNLTSDQKDALYWIMAEIQAGRLDDPFMIVWAGGHPIGNIPIPGRPTVVYPDVITESNLSALVAAGRLRERRAPLRTEYALTPSLTGWFASAPTLSVMPDSAAEPEPQPPTVASSAQDSTAEPDEPSATDHDRKVRLARFIDAWFDREELQNLCFDLGIDFYNLAGEKKESKARNLVTYMHSRGRLAELERKLAADRPEQYKTHH